jgi:hypothetical protein
LGPFIRRFADGHIVALPAAAAVRRRFRLFALLGALAALPAASAPSHTPPEYQVKAVFLYHFTRFVDWPDSAFGGAREPLTIGVLGADPFGDYLDSTVKGESKGARRITIKRLSRAAEARGCQILFIGRAQGLDLEPFLAELKDRPILTVGETETFDRSGGMIRFYTDRTRIRLRINLDGVQAAKLTISAKLLRLADLKTSGKG